MIVARAETAQQQLALVGPAVAVGIRHQPELRALTHVGRIPLARRDLEPGGNHQAVGEHRGLVGAAVSVRILEDDDLVVGRLARLEQRGRPWNRRPTGGRVRPSASGWD
jgi:hypothetical protein